MRVSEGKTPGSGFLAFKKGVFMGCAGMVSMACCFFSGAGLALGTLAGTAGRFGRFSGFGFAIFLVGSSTVTLWSGSQLTLCSLGLSTMGVYLTFGFSSLAAGYPL